VRLRWALVAGALAAVPGTAYAQPATSASAAPAPVSWDAGGVAVRISLPPGGEAVPDDQLPKLDLGGVEGAKVVLARGVRRATATPDHTSDVIVALCATAPGARLPAEAVPVVLEKMAELTRADLAKTTSIDRFEDGAVTEAPGRWDQPFSADGHLTAGGARLPVKADGRRTIGFVGAGPDALVCAVVCTEVSTDGARVCPAVLASLRYDGTFVAPPRASLPARVAFAAVRRPLPAVGALFGLLLFFAGVIVALMPVRRASLPTARPVGRTFNVRSPGRRALTPPAFALTPA
jgi:hypothetical protein